ncbi:MAG: hypothetical protein AAB617_01280, partial [Patescibacteria group bacterium]
KGDWPRFVSGEINPPDVHVGDIQRFKIVVESPSPIVSVVADIETDNGIKNLPLTNTRNQENGGGVWIGEWKVYDTHDTFYHTTFVARDQAGNENSLTLAWSDVCGIPFSGNWPMTSACTISSADGVIGTVALQANAGNLTINSSFGTNGSITINSGTSIVVGATISVGSYSCRPTGYTSPDSACVSNSICCGGWSGNLLCQNSSSCILQ